ncbi:HlyC/CorC family transporter [Zoogloea sp. LCSB751]|uniref:HlyC/CorC family transporter n=1 Tax=Zoogloea sp. LCSB751 TaxID=1965277 RepID=UPI0009A4EC7B|nr:CNNM domain-containing protein [Zoogloea sp. LCSB751]
MDSIPLSAQSAILAALLALSGFFSMAETAMMAANRYRLRSAAQLGSRGARLALDLLDQTDKLLGIILLFNNLVNAAAATLVSVITIQLFGSEEWVLGVSTLLVTFLILVFSEITPKVIGANHANRLACIVSYPLSALLKGLYFIVWFINLFVTGLLRLLRLAKHDNNDAHALSTEELRTLVLESGAFIPPKHRSILLNLFELEDITVEDVMTPRNQIEAVNIAEPLDVIQRHLATCYHTRLPVFDGEMNAVIGVLHVRRVLGQTLDHHLEVADIRQMLARPYFIPASTAIYSQLQFFQENRERLGLVVDEYGELLGLVTLEDIIEELIGKFTTTAPDAAEKLSWGADGSVLTDGSQHLRDLNRKLGLSLPLDGPKTLNGLILECLQDIPESGVSVKIANVPIEVVQAEDRRIKTARIFRPHKRK